MRGRLLIILMLVASAGYAQLTHVPGYVERNTRDHVTATMADSGAHVPAFNRPRIPTGIGARAGFVMVDSTGAGKGLYYSPGSGVLIRLRDTTEAGGRVKNGLTVNADTTKLGDSLTQYTYLQVGSHFLNNSPYTHLRLGNMPEAQSLNGVVGYHPLFNTYRPSPFSIETLYSTANGDINIPQYGGNISTIFRLTRDSTDAVFGAGLANDGLPGIGGEFVGQYYPPRDSTILGVGRDGLSGNVIFGQLDIGNSFGYNLNVVPQSGFPGFPISAGRTSIDLSRVIDNTRRKKMTGAGVSGFTTMYKTYQNTITGSTYEAGNYTDSIFGFRAYGDAYPLINQDTKTKALNVWTAKNVFGVYIDPVYRYTNTVDNGYSIYARGDSDFTVIRGFLSVGPTNPTRATNNFQHRVDVTGDVVASDSIKGFLTGGMGMFVSIPIAVGNEATINFTQTDSAQTTAMGAYLNPNRLFRGGYWRSEMYSAAVLDDNQTGGFLQIETGANHVNKTRWHRNGNVAIGYSTLVTDPYRLYKKLTVNGASAFLDTITYKNAPTGAAAGDTSNYKPLVINSNGDVFKGAWSGSGGGGGSGTVTDFIFTDGNGFDGTVTSSTSTPTLSLTTTAADTRVLYSSSGALTGSGQFTFTGQALQLASTNTTQTTTSSALAQTYNSLTSGTGQYIASSSLTSGNLINMVSTSTAKTGANTLLNINSSGANGSSSITNRGATISVTNTGTTSENRALELTASGATTNWAAYATAGNFRTVGAAGFYALNSAGTGGISMAYDNGTIGTIGTTGGIRLDLEAASSTILARRPFIVGIGIDFGNNVSLDVYKSASGTSNIQNWRSSGGTVLANVDQSGVLNLGLAGSAIGKYTQSGNTSGTITFQPQAAAGTYNMNWPTTAGSSGQALISGGGGSTAMTWLDLAGGGTNPTITGVANVASSSSPVLQYTRAGNRVSLSGYVNITPTAGTTKTTFRVSLPIASNFISVTEAPGTASATDGTTITAGTVGADGVNDQLTVSFTSLNTSDHNVTFSVTYVIQ